MKRQQFNCFVWLAAALLLFPSLAYSQPGDPKRGEALFVGTIVFATGGAPCLACHGIAGHELGYASGANYGPDLTALFGDYGAEGVIAVLEDLSAFESMQAIFANRPLEEAEIADLAAFFASVTGNENADISAGLAAHSLLLTALLLVLFGALGWRRFQGMRASLVDKSRFGKGGTA